MSVNWNSLSSLQQAQFLQAAGLDKLPEPAALDAAQIRLLAGIVGQETVASVTQGKRADSIASPTLPIATAVADWSNILAQVSELKAKAATLPTLSTESIATLSAGAADSKKANVERFLQILKTIGEVLPALQSGSSGKVAGHDFSDDEVKALMAGLLIMGGIGALVSLAFVAGALIRGDDDAVKTWLCVLGASVLIGVLGLPSDLDIGKELEKLVENVKVIAGKVGKFLKDNPDVVDRGLRYVLDMLVRNGTLSDDDALTLLSIGSYLANILGRLLAPKDKPVEEVSNAASQAVAKLLSGDDSGRIPELDRKVDGWLAQLQAKMQKNAEQLDEIIEQLNGSISGLGETLKDMTGPQQNIAMNRGM